jgi:general secretion pathway protein G
MTLAARHRGFTLIEIMVVIVILGVLAALVVPRVLDRPDEARNVAAKGDLATSRLGLPPRQPALPDHRAGLDRTRRQPQQTPVPPN